LPVARRQFIDQDVRTKTYSQVNFHIPASQEFNTVEML
jgi:hypothetical protein